VSFVACLLLRSHSRYMEGDLARYFDVFRVVGENLTLYAVFQRGDDGTPVGVILRIGGENELDIQREAQFEAPDLDVLFLQHVEQGYLDAGLQVGQLIDDEDTAMRARDQPEVDDALIVIGQFQCGCFDGVYVTDQVSYRYIRGGQLFGIARGAVQPGDGRVISLGFDLIARIP